MRAVVQRALNASVTIADDVVGGFDRPGLVALVGVTPTDTAADAQKISRRIAELRILDGEVSLVEADAPVLVISQFTLYADVKKGRRPSWHRAAPADVAEPLIDVVVDELRQRQVETHTGEFGADMNVSLTNNGPVTIIIDVPEAPA